MFKSVIWEFVGKFSNQILTFFISVILARLLLPAEFGLVGIVLVFVSFSGVVFDFGFRNAIINQHEVTSNTLSSIFFINLAAAFFLAIILFISSGFIASFYHEPLLEKLLNFATILFIANAVAIVPTSLNQKKLKFKANAIINTTATVVSGSIAIFMAYTGWGIWSILAKNIIQSLLVCCLNFFVCDWVPRLVFSFNSVKPMMAYSSTIFFTVVLDSVFQRIDVLIFGKKYEPSIVGYYTRAQTLESVPRDLTSGIIYSVFFPYFSKIKDNTAEVSILYKKCLHVVSLTILMINGILFLNAKQVIILLFTDKWVQSVEYFQFFLVIGFFFSLNAVIGILIASSGKYKLFLHSEFYRKGLLIPLYIWGFMGDINRFLFSLIIGYVSMLFINMVYAKKMIGLVPGAQIIIVLRYLIPAITTGLLCWFLFKDKIDNYILHIIVVGSVYLILNVALNVLMKNEGLQFLLSKTLLRYRKF